MNRLAGPALLAAAVLPGCASWQGSAAPAESVRAPVARQAPEAADEHPEAADEHPEAADEHPELADEHPPGAGAVAQDAARPSAAPLAQDHPAPVAPRFVRGAALLDASLEDGDGACTGRLLDLLIEPGSGRVVGVLLELEPAALPVRPAPEAPALRLLDPDRLLWTVEDEVLRVALFGPVSAPPVEAGGDQEPTRVAGHVTGIEPGTSGELVLKLRDASNLVHRVLVEPACLVREELERIAASGPVEARGVLTRDSNGKLLVASDVTAAGSAPLVLRGSGGGILWRSLARGLRSGRALLQGIVTTSDGARLEVVDWLLDAEVLATTHVLVRTGGVERVLPWAALAWEPDGRLRVDGASEWVEALPASFQTTAAEDSGAD